MRQRQAMLRGVVVVVVVVASIVVACGDGHKVPVDAAGRDADACATADFAKRSEFVGMKFFTNLTTGDIDGDGFVDVYARGSRSSNISGGVSSDVLLNTHDGDLRQLPDVGGYGGCESMVVADVNGDGHADLLCGALQESELSVLLGAGDGTWTGSPL